MPVEETPKQAESAQTTVAAGLNGHVLMYSLVPVLSLFWLTAVSKYVPEPYLDEFFHIPQAQTYCAGTLDWDDKITTPPGLYAYSVAILKLMRLPCGALQLRATNTLALFALLVVASRCRSLIESIPFVKSPKALAENWRWSGASSAYAVHTAVNIALFPPLFFFSGLYYTDVLSTCAVLYAYKKFLAREGAYRDSVAGSWGVVFAGFLALTLRQTNIFWVAVFTGGLEAVRTVKLVEPLPAEKRRSKKRPFQVGRYKRALYAHGELDDDALGRASVWSIYIFLYSFVVAILCNLQVVLVRLWPYIALLISFAGFVVVNGGVVLGDKSNHVATVHLPQMLYIWPFFVFFSAPLLYVYGIEMLQWVKTSILGPRTRDQEEQLKFWNFLPSIIMTLGGLGGIVGIVHFNTIIHPFTLADNRHYVFYVFRYTILRHPYIRYLLAPIYLFCAWLVCRGLSGAANAPSLVSTQRGRAQRPWGVQDLERRKEPDERSREDLVPFHQAPQPDGNDTSFATIWLLATALSLITAPLVEPRYYIIPWVIWRLHVPALPVKEKWRGGSWIEQIRYWAYAGHDHRLWLETAWFLAINLITGYIFLFKGFKWPQEPGNIQRFMW